MISMTAVSAAPAPVRPSIAVPPLEMGDHLDQPTFHARYEAMPKGFRAELIGGMVYVPSPLRQPHGRTHAHVTAWLTIYHSRVPGATAADNSTNILGPDSEPQPDVLMTLEGGRTRVNAAGYLEGPPEFIAEVASSTAAYDLHAKRMDYERYGVGEYLVVLTEESRIVWFIREGAPSAAYSELKPDSDGIYRSPSMPGLWLDAAALLRYDVARVLEVLNAGMATPEYSAFASRKRP